MKNSEVSGAAQNPNYSTECFSLVDHADLAGQSFVASISRSEQKAAGQFMTPPKIARFMARRLVQDFDQEHVRLLEPSAGSGILVAATVEALLEKQKLPNLIQAHIFEKDKRLVKLLHEQCSKIYEVCLSVGVNFEYKIFEGDFLLSEIALRGNFIENLVVIANPPFFKLNANNDERAQLHDYAVYGQPNIYGLFMAATARLVAGGGRWCFISPRSWMSGQYFRAVRQTILRNLEINSLHAFDSRRDSFQDDAVLQEMVISWAKCRSAEDPSSKILFSRSKGVSDLDNLSVQAVSKDQVFKSDAQATLMYPSDDVSPLSSWSATLATFGLKISTGPVVAFRCRDSIGSKRSSNTVPLLWMQHVSQQRITWPICKKLEHIRVDAESDWALVPNSPMVIMRRFSPKEVERRITCAPYFGTLPGAVIGLENHLNYIHRPGGRMSAHEVNGLSALLASSIVDRYLRAIAGSTQINAGELRVLPLPPIDIIESIGRRLRHFATLDEIDAAVEVETGISTQAQSVAA